MLWTLRYETITVYRSVNLNSTRTGRDIIIGMIISWLSLCKEEERRVLEVESLLKGASESSEE